MSQPQQNTGETRHRSESRDNVKTPGPEQNRIYTGFRESSDEYEELRHHDQLDDQKSQPHQNTSETLQNSKRRVPSRAART